MAVPRILTTTVGSYPVPDWLMALPSEQALLDATRTVIATQEKAGIDLVCDGELYRFDVNHPETNGMIEYFVRPLMDSPGYRLGGMENLQTSARYAISQSSACCCGCADRCRIARSASCLRKSEGFGQQAIQVYADRPAHVGQNALNKHYKNKEALAFAIADLLVDQVKELDADVVQIDEANLPGAPDEWGWAAEAINRVLRAVKTTAAVHLCFGNYGGQTIQNGGWKQLIHYLNALNADHIVMETAHRPAEELEVFKELRPEIGLGLGVIDIKQTVIESADSIACAIERAHTVVGVEPYSCAILLILLLFI